MVRRSVGLILVLLSATTVPAGVVTAQEPGDEPFATVLIPFASLDLPVHATSDQTMGDLLQTISVHADGELCATADTVARLPNDGQGNLVLALGLPGQPAVCSTEGAIVAFSTPAHPGDFLARTYNPARGDVLVLESFLPLPLTPSAPPDAFATVVFPFLGQPVVWEMDIPVPEGALLADVARYVAVYADGQLCFQVDLVPGMSGELLLPLGLTGQPAACSTAGTLITWRTGILPDEDMVTRWRLEPGALMQITSLAPLIPESGPPPEMESATVVIPGSLLLSPVPARGGPTWAQLLGAITILADGERCAGADVRAVRAEADYPIRIGGPYQPEACSREGARITFRAEKGRQPTIDLDAAFTLKGDQPTFTLDSFAPLPPPLGEPAQVPEGEAFATVRFPQDLLEHVPNPWQDDAPTLGEIWRTMSIHANGELCGTVDTAATDARNAEGDLLFVLGTADQPDPCRTEGALVTFRRGDHPVSLMALMLWLERDATLVFNEAGGGIESPPVTGPGEPPAPPLVGTGGVRNTTSPRTPWLVVGGVVLAAASVGSFWMARRTP